LSCLSESYLKAWEKYKTAKTRKYNKQTRFSLDFEVCCQSKIIQYRPCAAVCFNEYDLPSIEAYHSLHKVTSFCTVSSHKGVQHLSERNVELFSMRHPAAKSYRGVQHFFERNIELFSKRLTAVQSSVEEVKKFMEGGQHYDKMKSFK
jgi:hypothetical protein